MMRSSKAAKTTDTQTGTSAKKRKTETLEEGPKKEDQEKTKEDGDEPTRFKRFRKLVAEAILHNQRMYNTMEERAKKEEEARRDRIKTGKAIVGDEPTSTAPKNLPPNVRARVQSIINDYDPDDLFIDRVKQIQKTKDSRELDAFLDQWEEKAQTLYALNYSLLDNHKIGFAAVLLSGDDAKFSEMLERTKKIMERCKNNELNFHRFITLAGLYDCEDALDVVEEARKMGVTCVDPFIGIMLNPIKDIVFWKDYPKGTFFPQYQAQALTLVEPVTKDVKGLSEEQRLQREQTERARAIIQYVTGVDAVLKDENIMDEFYHKLFENITLGIDDDDYLKRRGRKSSLQVLEEGWNDKTKFGEMDYDDFRYAYSDIEVGWMLFMDRIGAPKQQAKPAI